MPLSSPSWEEDSANSAMPMKSMTTNSWNPTSA